MIVCIDKHGEVAAIGPEASKRQAERLISENKPINTSDYVVMKWLDLLNDGTVYFTISEPGSRACASVAEVQNNPVLDTYEALYNAELERTIERIDTPATAGKGE